MTRSRSSVSGLRFVPAERVHVITAAPRGSDAGLLWQRFASLLDIDPDSVDISRARANTSLGLPEIEFLRRLNAELPREVPDWFYMWNVKEALAHQTLATRPVTGRLVLPEDRNGWAKEHADILISRPAGLWLRSHREPGRSCAAACTPARTQPR